jgi:tetratricopeptide (TPR) repeat protein
VPPTIQALIEARLDGLGRADRAALEPAAVIGLEFPHVAVETMVPDAVKPTLTAHLDTLAKKHLIRPAHNEHGELLYRFHHQLVRDTTYNGLLKRNRANLHLAFVRWADKVNADRDRALEFEEILGYHLEQAHRYLKELGPLDEAGRSLGTDAARRLSSAARRALGRGDMHASANLFRRAVNLLDEADPDRMELLPHLAETVMELGDFVQARMVLAEAQAAAERTGNRRIAESAKLLQMRVRLFSTESDDWSAETLRVAGDAIPVLEREAAHPELARAWRLIGFVHGIAARYGESSDAVNRSMIHARLAGDERLMARNAMGLSISTLQGPTPVPTAIEQCERMLADGLSDRQAESKILCTLAQLRAMNGDFDQARALYRRGRGLLRELGQGLNAAATGIDLLAVELLAGDLATAEREVMADYDFLVRAGENYFLSTIAAMLSRVVRDQGRDDDALNFSALAEEKAAEDDIESQALWRSIRAPILARGGRLAEAEELARHAVGLSQKTDAPTLKADTLADLAGVMLLAGRLEDARQSIGAAISIYRFKGDVVSAARTTDWAARLG